jgi:hypothetical protein
MVSHVGLHARLTVEQRLGRVEYLSSRLRAAASCDPVAGARETDTG